MSLEIPVYLILSNIYVNRLKAVSYVIYISIIYANLLPTALFDPKSSLDGCSPASPPYPPTICPGVAHMTEHCPTGEPARLSWGSSTSPRIPFQTPA